MRNFGLRGIDETICNDRSRRAGASQSILAGRTAGTMEEEKEEGAHKESTAASKCLHTMSSKKIIFIFNVFVYTYVRVCIFVFLCMHMCVPVHMGVCMNICMRERVCTHICIKEHVCVPMCPCCVCVCACVRESPDCDCVGQSTTGGCYSFLSPCGSQESDLFVRLDKRSFIP